jgi:hypothetical protein
MPSARWIWPGALCLIALPGCGAVSKSECQSGDWYDIGVRDGARGYGEERFLENAKACAKHGLAADREQWLDGRMRGLERYCTPRNAFGVGARNESYAGVCPQYGEEDFLRAFGLGKDLAAARAHLAHWNGEISEIRDKLDRDDRRRKEKKDDTASDDKKDDDLLSSSERVELGVQLGIALVKREDALREVDELEARGREL